MLFASPVPSEQRKVGAEQGEGYTHYVGDFAADGFAPVYRKDGGAVERYVDRHYYLYDQNKDPLYCQQLGSSAFVQQNVFFYKAELHVMATSYLWLISSNDAGATWSDPLMLNEQVRTNLPGGNAAFYGVGPGRGLVTSGGRIVPPVLYLHPRQGRWQCQRHLLRRRRYLEAQHLPAAPDLGVDCRRARRRPLSVRAPRLVCGFARRRCHVGRGEEPARFRHRRLHRLPDQRAQVFQAHRRQAGDPALVSHGERPRKRQDMRRPCWGRRRHRVEIQSRGAGR